MGTSNRRRDFGEDEAKRQLSRLLARVAKGERITITKKGVPIAHLVPVRDRPSRKVARAIAGLREFQKTHSLGRSSLRKLIDQGRR